MILSGTSIDLFQKLILLRNFAVFLPGDGENKVAQAQRVEESAARAAPAERARKVDLTRALNFSGCSCSGIMRQKSNTSRLAREFNCRSAWPFSSGVVASCFPQTSTIGCVSRANGARVSVLR